MSFSIVEAEYRNDEEIDWLLERERQGSILNLLSIFFRVKERKRERKKEKNEFLLVKFY